MEQMAQEEGLSEAWKERASNELGEVEEHSFNCETFIS